MKKTNTKASKLRSKRTSVNEKGITLVALVVTIIILLILAGVTLNLALSNNGLIGRAKQAANKYAQAQQNEAINMDETSKFIDEQDIEGKWNDKKHVNKPMLNQGMIPVKFEKESGEDEFKIVKTTENDENWYDYENQQWANAQTEDGSLWVWIPRYAYKIPSANYQSKTSGIIDIKFLVGTSDSYYDDTNKITNAYRCQTEDEVVNTSEKHVVHPAFTDESKIKFRNGGWDKELTGIWVAKFEAGYANAIETGTKVLKNEDGEDVKVKSTDNINTAPIKASNVKYTVDSTNWYGVYNSSTPINYPTFQGSTYSINYININDAFNLCKALNDDGNIYGLSYDTDTHLIKKSEWGAVAYLSQSKYGYKGKNSTATDILTNTKDINKETVRVVTGYNNISKEWNKGGEGASTTQNVYGIYDMNGGIWEYCATFISNGHPNLSNNGKNLAYETINNNTVLRTENNKYIMIYKNKNPENSNFSTAQQENYLLNNLVYGDAMRETSTAGTGENSWNNDYSLFVAQNYPFVQPGAGWASSGSRPGLFAWGRETGAPLFDSGFRAVLIKM